MWLQQARGRHTSPPEEVVATCCAAQDLDVDMKLQLSQGLHTSLLEQIAADVALLERCHVMDYSMLLGLQFRSWSANEWHPPRPMLLHKVGATGSHPDSGQEPRPSAAPPALLCGRPHAAGPCSWGSAPPLALPGQAQPQTSQTPEPHTPDPHNP